MPNNPCHAFQTILKLYPFVYNWCDKEEEGGKNERDDAMLQWMTNAGEEENFSWLKNEDKARIMKVKLGLWSWELWLHAAQTKLM